MDNGDSDMHNKNQKITLIILIIGTILLGVTTLIISLQLQNQQSLTDTSSQAASEACKATFTVTPDGATPTPATCEIAFTLVNPSLTPTITSTPSPTPNPQCGVTTCSSDAECPSGHSCPTSGQFANKCVLTHCVSSPSQCNSNGCALLPTATPTNSPSITPSSVLTATPTNTPPPGSCSASCNNNSDCANNMVCANGMCRNPECTEQPNCACYFVPTPEVPVTGAGATILGIGVIAGGIILLLLGMLL